MLGTRYSTGNSDMLVCTFVGSCLATKVFIDNLPAMGRGQNGYLTVIGVHSTMHLMHVR